MMLPSPSSLNLPMGQAFPPPASPVIISQTSPQVAHLHDLQHQVSVKTLAHQTLQREYDALIQKLQRMQLKSQALEKKFQVSDAEINTLASEKEKLSDQVQILEVQVEELQQARDEARKIGAESNAQYMKIVEMAGRIQGQGVDSMKTWEQERASLLARIKILEQGKGMVHRGQGDDSSGSVAEPDLITASPWGDGQQPVHTPPRLTEDMQSLRRRNEVLEKALQAAGKDSRAVREAALALETSINQALRGTGP